MNAFVQAVGEAETTTPDPNGEDFCGFKALGLPSSGTCRPFLWQDGVMTRLPTLGGDNGVANQINNLGDAAGAAENAAPDLACPAPQVLQFKPVVWENRVVRELPTFGGDTDGVAFAINESGHAVGASGDCSTFNSSLLASLVPLHALLWEGDKMTDLGNLGGTGHGFGNVALNLNHKGQVVGQSDLPGDKKNHAFLWTRETGMRDLGALPGDFLSVGSGINDQGDVVGVSVNRSFNARAFLFHDGTMTDLNTLVPAGSPLYLLLACSIDSSVGIVGVALTGTGEAHGYLATPSNGATAAQGVSSPVVLSGDARMQLRRQLPLGRVAARFTGIR